MAEKTRKNFWGLSRESLLSRHLQDGGPGDKKPAHVFVHLGKKALVPKMWKDGFRETAGSATALLRVAESPAGVNLLVSPLAPNDPETDLRLKARPASRVRDAMGSMVSMLERLEVETAEVHFDFGGEELDAAILGLEIALYRYKRVIKGDDPKLRFSLKSKGKALGAKQLGAGVALGQGVNLARHLVNLPPNELNPVSYADFAQEFFRGLKNIKVEVWDEKRLRQENMNLHYAVGQGSEYPPRLVRLRYQPPGAAKRAPVAFVGKGITFDTGGLDIKPSSGMRLMKKDMGGSASVLGLMYWAALSGVKVAVDAYLPLAENAVSGQAFHPSDVITSRSGQTIEIHNTDAEGRLVLADSLDLAVTQKEKPRFLIDVATLTGAIKVALGSQLAGLFSNNPKLRDSLAAAGLEAGDLTWPMPLFQRYRSQMNSPFADMVNAIDGFGGAVTAALFLEKFVKDVPWAHFDIYAWKDSAEGCWLESGGSGQSIMGLAAWLEGL